MRRKLLTAHTTYKAKWNRWSTNYCQSQFLKKTKASCRLIPRIGGPAWSVSTDGSILLWVFWAINACTGTKNWNPTTEKMYHIGLLKEKWRHEKQHWPKHDVLSSVQTSMPCKMYVFTETAVDFTSSAQLCLLNVFGEVDSWLPQGYFASGSAYSINDWFRYSHNSAVIQTFHSRELCLFWFIWYWWFCVTSSSIQTLLQNGVENCVSPPLTTRSSQCSSCSLRALISFPSLKCADAHQDAGGM